jgi:Fe2+ or Zn2+ uptake regulation protein
MNQPQPPAVESLRRAGHRVTQARLAVLQVLAEQDAGLSPQEIWERGRAIYGPLGLVTVYRTLALLNELSLASRVHSEQDCHAYAAAKADRHHLLCSGCHRLVEFPCQGLDALVDAVQTRTGFRVTEHLLELTGLCPDCQEADTAPPSPPRPDKGYRHE